MTNVATMATRQRRTRRQRLPPEEGRRVLLEAGRDHLYENPLGEPLDHVRITDIVDRLGLSIGAVYHYWDSQDDYRDDLLELLLSPSSRPRSTTPASPFPRRPRPIHRSRSWCGRRR